ncbi:MAG: sulfur oxidation c-type cytochrome SoxA [Pseudomonadota bacterium]
MAVRAPLIFMLFVLGGCSDTSTKTPDFADRPDLDPSVRVSGFTFLTEETQALQQDDFANPGQLWVDRGAALFGDGEAACSSCHEPDDFSHTATQYPQWNSEHERLINLEGQINQCRTTRQDQPALAYESDDLLALTTFVATQARGDDINVSLTPEMQSAYQSGRDYFFTRRGQLNLACSQCHDDQWGMQLRGDTISQGHSNGFPAYRLQWETLGSLHRRLEECDLGVRAEPRPLGSDEYLAVELYLAIRAQGLPIETPAVRR